MKRTTALALSMLVSMSAFAADPASPQATSKTTTKRKATSSSSVSAEIQQMKDALAAQQRQIEELKQQVSQRDQAIQQTQQQLNQIQSSAAAAQAKADEAAAASAKVGEGTATLEKDVTDLKANNTAAALEMQETQKRIAGVESPLAIHYKGVTITPGAFLAAETVWRQHALFADINTPFNSLVFPGSGQYNTSEFFGSGRQSRLSFLVQGKLKSMNLTGYYEMDWLSAGVTSNNNESNSYTNRQRQLWGQIATQSGWNITGGQMWSLVTETRKGLDNRTEALPMTIDPQYTVGFSWARQYGFRVTKNFNNKFWLGASVENPQVTFAAANAPTNFFFGAPGNASGLYNAFNGNYSANYLPDFIVKAAFEPGIGHYEVFGIVSNERARVYPAATLATPSAAGAFNSNVTGGGIGANARFSAHKVVDFGLHFLGGNGIGRYGTSGLTDVTVHPDGTPALIRSYQGLATLEFHTKKWDVYFNGGEEYAGRNSYLSPAGKLVGYGVQSLAATGCFAEVVPGAGGFAPGAAAACTVNTRAMFEGTGGFWYKLYNGDRGRIQFGPQYSYVKRMTWQGVGGSPTTDENMFFTSFRYYLP
jgi:hypothetical protein